MSAERLSRLQKWILEDVYLTGNWAGGPDNPRPIWRRAVYMRAWDDGMFTSKDDRAGKVVFSRSIWGLIEKGYIEGQGPTTLNLWAMVYGMKGKAEADFKKDFADVLKEPKANQAVAGPAFRGIVQAKLISLTLKGRAKAKQLLALKEGLKVNPDKLAISLGPGMATVATEGTA